MATSGTPQSEQKTENNVPTTSDTSKGDEAFSEFYSEVILAPYMITNLCVAPCLHGR